MQEKILIIAHLSFSGMGPYVSEIVNTLSPNDNINYFFFDMEDNFFEKNVKPELHSKSIFFKFHHGIISKADFLLGYYSAKYRRKLLSYCVKNGITIVHFINGCTDTKVLNKLHKKGIKTLVTVHDLHPHEQKKEFYKIWKYKVLAKQEMQNFKICPNLLTNSRLQYEELKRMFPEKNIFFHEFPSLVSSEIKNGNEIPPELRELQNKYILFLGRIEEYKGIELLFDAFCQSSILNNKYTLVLAGKGKLPTKITAQTHNVILINRYIADKEIAYLYRNAAAVVYPYISATQSGVLSLACFFRTPMLVSDIPYFTSMVRQSKIAMTFKSGCIEDLTKQLKCLLNSDTLQIKKDQQVFYNKYYSNVSIRNSLLNIYLNLK